MKEFFIAILLFSCTCVNAQLMFQKTYGTAGWELASCGYTEGGASICKAGENGYVFTGSSSANSSQARRAALIRIDMNGDTLWTCLIGDGFYHYYANSVQPTSDGGFISAMQGGSTGVLLAKVSGSGQLLWLRSYDNANSGQAYHAIETSDGNIVMLANTTQTSYYVANALMIKTDQQGNLLWGKEIRLNQFNSSYSVRFIELADHGFCIAASYAYNSYDAALIRTDSAANVVWAKYFGAIGGSEIIYDLKEMNGAIVTVGYSTSYGAGEKDVWVTKTDMSGNLITSKSYGDSNHQWAVTMTLTTDGGLAVAGCNSMGQGDGDGLLLKLDSALNLQWSMLYSAPLTELFVGVLQVSDNGFMLYGYTNSLGAGGYDMYLVKTDPTGNCLCMTQPITYTDTTATPIFTALTTTTAVQTQTALETPVVESGLIIMTHCSNVGIAEYEQVSMCVYPNPASDLITVEPEREGNYLLCISTATGQVVLLQRFTTTRTTVRLSSLAEGVYFLELYEEGGAVGVQKIIVQ